MSTETLKQSFKKIFYFRNLSEIQTEEMANVSRLQQFENGEMIFAEGEDAKAFFVILSGRIQIYKISQEGKEMILHLFGPGEIFAEVPIFSDIPRYPANAIALSPSILLRIDGQGFRQLVKAHPEIALNMLVVFAKRLHEFSEIIEDLSLRSVDSRLAKYLLSVSENSPNQAEILIQKKTLAAILGTIPETLSRSFKKLVSDSLIQVNGNTIELLNRQKLSLLADYPEKH